MPTLQTFEITNNQMVLRVLNLGGIITELLVPDKNGQLTNVVLGYEDNSDYLTDTSYLGCIAGRFANRIGAGIFQIDGKSYHLATNNGKNHLHGGINGFNKVYWQVNKISDSKLILTYTSPHLEEGYPGKLEVTIIYELTKENELSIEYKAHTDQETVINLTNHSYFNLSGSMSKTILDHIVKVESTRIVEVNVEQIPTGILKDITKTPFDFLEAKNIGQAMDSLKKKDKEAIGFDHCYAFDGSSFKKMAEVTCETTGIAMKVFSTEPGVQLYTGNNLTAPFKQFNALCLETQHFPDSPNQKNFPSTLLKPEEEFYSKTVYKFSNFKQI